MKSPRVGAGSGAVVIAPKAAAAPAASVTVTPPTPSTNLGDMFVNGVTPSIATADLSTATIVSTLDWDSATGPMSRVEDEMAAALERMEFPLSATSIRQMVTLETAVPDSTVEALRVRVLTDTDLAGNAATTLRHYSAEALSKGVATAEAKLLRLDLLMMAAPSETRPALMEAVRFDLDRQSDAIKRFLQTPGLGLDAAGKPKVYVPQITIGGGPQGQTIANKLHELNLGKGNLIIDASLAGEGNFGSVRSHPLNSRTRDGYLGTSTDAMKNPKRTGHPVHGSVVQVEDLNPGPTPMAGDMGDAASLGLYAAFTRGTEIVTEAKVTNIEARPDAEKGKLVVTFRDRTGQEYRLLTDQVVDATGLGAPSFPVRDEASQKFVEAQARALSTGAMGLPAVQVAHSEDFLRATNASTDAEILDFVRSSKGNLVIAGFGDSSKTPLLRLLAVAERSGTTFAELLGDRRIEWLGPATKEELVVGLWGPYKPLLPLVEQGLIEPSAGRLESLVASGDSQSTLAVKRADGTIDTKQAGRVLLALGMRGVTAELAKGLVPEFSASSLVPVHGYDPVFGDSTGLGAQLTAKGIALPYFVAGVATKLEKPKDTSFLDYFSWKTLQLTEQVLAGGISSNENPFSPLRVTPQNRSALSGKSTSSSSASFGPVGVRPNVDGATIAAQTALFGVMSRFSLPGRERVDLSFIRSAKGLSLEATGLDRKGVEAVVRALEEHPQIVGVIDRLCTAAPVSMTVRVVDGQVAEVR